MVVPRGVAFSYERSNPVLMSMLTNTHSPYRGTSLIRNINFPRDTIGPSRAILLEGCRGRAVSNERGTPAVTDLAPGHRRSLKLQGYLAHEKHPHLGSNSGISRIIW